MYLLSPVNNPSVTYEVEACDLQEALIMYSLLHMCDIEYVRV